MNEHREPDAWRARSRIPRAAGAWIGVARVRTAPAVDDSWADDFEAESVDGVCIEDLPVPEHLDAKAWAASMLAAEARRLDAPRGKHGEHLRHRANHSAWSDEPEADAWDAECTQSPAVAGREYSARRTPLSSGNAGRHHAPRALRLVYSADRAEPDAPAQRSEGETYEGPVNRPGGHTAGHVPTPTEETTPA
ncbi:hypothetical protein [Cryptosporangium phraense]|uniref:Uncharacterized protein n=1 Tax=Cryptosporangium phraense TaxID=2593070 RepID=A0A545AVQ3_9ACTN|nr:hypothetical protein [Cryptosporangium phraense]TQS45417.1 hypothetical protein FL583_10065 [Cryptosporangium phraense]